MRTFVVMLVAGIGIIGLTATGELAAQFGDGAAPVPAAIRAANSRFAGVWKLVGEETRDANGQAVSRGPNGDNAGRFGYIVYDPAGYMGVNLAWLKQPVFAGGKATTPQDALAAMGAYNSYWGSFAVNDARGIVTHQTFGALSPAFAGTNQERQFTFSGNQLTLRPPTAANGDQRTLTWERVPDLPEPDADASEADRVLEADLVRAPQRERRAAVVVSRQTGFLVYTASGHVMVHMMQPYRRRNVGASPTPDETMATYRSYTSYFGPYTVNESEKYVVHHLAAAINSGAAGTDFQRFIEFAGKRLILKPPVTKDSSGESVQTAITWERLSD